MSMGDGRYKVVHVGWGKGERKGLRRRPRLVSTRVGWSDSIEAAAAILAVVPMYADEAVYIYDRELGGTSVACKLGSRSEIGRAAS